MKFDEKPLVLVLGSDGLVGSAVVRKLRKNLNYQVVPSNRKSLDLLSTDEVLSKILEIKPDYIVNAAAQVGSLTAHLKFPYEFLDHNIRIQSNVFRAAANVKVKKIINYASIYIYPNKSNNVMRETDLIGGNLNQNYANYALSKIVGIKLLEALNLSTDLTSTTLVLPNVYGINDSLNLNNSRVVASISLNLSDPKNKEKVLLRGSGKQIREFIFSDDVADATEHFLDSSNSEGLVNIGDDKYYRVCDIAEMIKTILNYSGLITWDSKGNNEQDTIKTNKTKMKKFGWKPKTSLHQGLLEFHGWFGNQAN